MKSKRRGKSGERGVALVLTLMMLALLTILAISFTMTQMTENKAAANFAYAAKAEEYGRGGLDMAIAILIEDRDNGTAWDTTYDIWGADYSGSDGFSVAGLDPNDPNETLTNLLCRQYIVFCKRRHIRNDGL